MANDKKRKRKAIERAVKSPELGRTAGGALAIVAADRPNAVFTLTPAGLSTTTGERVISVQAARDLLQKQDKKGGPLRVSAIDAFKAENAVRRRRSSTGSRTVRS